VSREELVRIFQKNLENGSIDIHSEFFIVACPE
jgi:hypothetical protein